MLLPLLGVFNMYTAEIISKRVQYGMLTVIVRYSNGTESFDDTIQTNQKQSDSWVYEMIARRLKDIHGVLEILPKIKLGPVDLTSKENNKETSDANENNSPKEEYKKDLSRFNKFLEAMRIGATDDKNSDFLALKAKLKTNFDTSYLDLF